MNLNALSLAYVSDDQLLVRVKELVDQERAATAQLLVHLAEMEERKLHCQEGCSSLFTYCVEILRLSEPAAYRRVKASRIARRFPIVLELLADGSIHLAGLDVLAAHLTDANHVAVLAEARHKTKREVEELVARLRPLPDAPPVVRKLPEPRPTRTGLVPPPVDAEPGSESIRVGAAPADMPAEHRHESGGSPAIPDPKPAHRPTVAPLSPTRYWIQFTADAETYRKLRQVQELLRHRVSDGDPATIVDTALTLLLEKLLREKTGATRKPPRRKETALKTDRIPRERPPAPGAGGRRQQRIASGKPSESRHIPAAVKRGVWKRDGGRCAFRAADGRRCSSRGPLEYHHIEPYMLGGKATIANISLRCRAHNAYEGELQFGRRRTRVPGEQAPNILETLPGESFWGDGLRNRSRLRGVEGINPAD